MDWKREIQELHDVFQGYFRGELDSLERVEVALAEDFTIVGPGGNEADRSATLQALVAGQGRAPTLHIETTDHRRLFEHGDVVAVRYIEVHATPEAESRRLSTVIFSRQPDAPHGLLWRMVHETWLDN